MAIIRLHSPVEWGWDTDTQQLVMLMREREINPEAPEPVREAVVRLDVAGLNLRNIVG